MKAIAPGDEITSQFVAGAIFPIPEARRIVLQTIETYGFRFEQNLASRRKPRCDQVFDHLLLGINRNRPSNQFLEIYSMAMAGEA